MIIFLIVHASSCSARLLDFRALIWTQPCHLYFLFLLFLLFFYWSIIVLQCCVSFCFSTKWISCVCSFQSCWVSHAYHDTSTVPFLMEILSPWISFLQPSEFFPEFKNSPFLEFCGASACMCLWSVTLHVILTSFKMLSQMYRTDFWTLWEKARVGCFERTALKHVYYL